MNNTDNNNHNPLCYNQRWCIFYNVGTDGYFLCCFFFSFRHAGRGLAERSESRAASATTCYERSTDAGANKGITPPCTNKTTQQTNLVKYFSCTMLLLLYRNVQKPYPTRRVERLPYKRTKTRSPVHRFSTSTHTMTQLRRLGRIIYYISQNLQVETALRRHWETGLQRIAYGKKQRRDYSSRSRCSITLNNLHDRTWHACYLHKLDKFKLEGRGKNA